MNIQIFGSKKDFDTKKQNGILRSAGSGRSLSI